MKQSFAVGGKVEVIALKVFGCVMVCYVFLAMDLMSSSCDEQVHVIKGVIKLHVKK